MKWLTRSGAVLAALILAIIVIGAIMPKTHVVTRTISLAQPPEAVWQAITDYASQPSWRADLKKTERIDGAPGLEVWRETYESGDELLLETRVADAPKRLVRRIADVGGPFSGEWQYNLSSMKGGTEIAITEHGTVPNPFFRVVSKYVIGHSTYLDRYLVGLGARFGEKVEPRNGGGTGNNPAAGND